MTLATTQIARLVVHARNEADPSTPSGSRAPSDEDVDKSRIEAMNTLVSALKRNARVRYEIDMTELIQAYVSHPSLNCIFVKCYN